VECGIGWAKEVTKVGIFFFNRRIGAILGTHTYSFWQKVFAHTAAMQIAKAGGAVVVTANRAWNIRQISAAVPANHSAHGCRGSKLALRACIKAMQM